MIHFYHSVLFTNLLTDISEMTIAIDNVDKDLVAVPRRWNIKFILKYMMTFGLLSSIFDYVTFGVLIFFLHANEYLFRTGWFIESVLSASIVVLIIRTKDSFYKSKPGKYLIIAISSAVIATLAIPYTRLGALFGFVRLPVNFIFILLIILIAYMVLAEITKKIFYKYVKY